MSLLDRRGFPGLSMFHLRHTARGPSLKQLDRGFSVGKYLVKALRGTARLDIYFKCGIWFAIIIIPSLVGTTLVLIHLTFRQRWIQENGVDHAPSRRLSLIRHRMGYCQPPPPGGSDPISPYGLDWGNKSDRQTQTRNGTGSSSPSSSLKPSFKYISWSMTSQGATVRPISKIPYNLRTTRRLVLNVYTYQHRLRTKPES